MSFIACTSPFFKHRLDKGKWALRAWSWDRLALVQSGKSHFVPEHFTGQRFFLKHRLFLKMRSFQRTLFSLSHAESNSNF